MSISNRPRRLTRPWQIDLVGLALCLAVSCGAYYLDKRAAQEDRQRVPESLLHWLDLLGGWPGALCATFTMTPTRSAR